MSWQKAGVLAMVSPRSSEPYEVTSYRVGPGCKDKIRAHMPVCTASIPTAAGGFHGVNL